LWFAAFADSKELLTEALRASFKALAVTAAAVTNIAAIILNENLKWVKY
jgi:hypothetical protein